jgi:flagellar basal body rod protein FlgF
VPVTVTTTVPATVKVQESVEVGESVVTLAGVRVQAELSAVRATVPEKPFRGDIVIVEVPGELTTTVTAVGLVEIVKSGGAVTLKSTETEWDRDPLVPVTVTATTPVAVKVHDSVEEPEPPVTMTGANVQAELSAVSATSSANPLMGETVMVEVPGEPTVVVTVDGVAVKVKSAIPVTV